MACTPDTVPENLVEELRNQLLSEIDKKSLDINPDDLERAKTDDFWLKRFLAHHDNNVSLALKMMCVALNWRKKFGANEVSESNINLDLINLGALFPHGKDIDGKAILIIKGKRHVRGAFEMDDVRRCVVYWMERLEKTTKGDLITVFFDLEGAGLKNLDMDFMKFLIGLLNENYPYFLNYILIFEMPWVLNAAFKIIKSWLPPKAVEKIQFINKKDITNFVPVDEALRSWGGTNDYEFKFIPYNKKEGSRKVQFSDSTSMSNNTSGSQKKENGPLKIRPSHCLTFVQQGSQTSSSVELTNTDSSRTLSFKLKTTSPEKFLVKPSAGIISPNDCVKVTVAVLPGYNLASGLDKEKFLVMSSVIVEGPETLDLSDFWKAVPKNKVYLQRLKCAQNSKEKRKAPNVPENSELAKLTMSLERIERLLTSLLVLSLVFVVAIFYLFYIRSV